MLVVPQNILAPQAITVVFNTPTFGVDLSTITAVSFGVTRRDGTTATWTATIVSAVPGELVAQYAPLSGDITGTGVYTLAPTLTTQAGKFSADAIAMMVEPPGLTSPNLEQATWVIPVVQVATLGPVHSQWFDVGSGTYAATSSSPFVDADLRHGSATVQTWTALPGDILVVADTYGACGATASLTILAAAGQSFAPSAASSTRYTTTLALPARFKMGNANAWIGW